MFRMFRKEGLALGHCGLHRDPELILTLGALLSCVLVTRTVQSKPTCELPELDAPYVQPSIYIHICIYLWYIHIAIYKF